MRFAFGKVFLARRQPQGADILVAGLAALGIHDVRWFECVGGRAIRRKRGVESRVWYAYAREVCGRGRFTRMVELDYEMLELGPSGAS